MRSIITTLAFSMFLCGYSTAQKVPVIDLDVLEARLAQGGDTTYVINFWATWCGPCVKELPFFEAIHTNRATEPFKVLLVTLDFLENLDSKVVPFLLKKNIQSEVALLDEGNPNKWIPRVSDAWSGAIPATLFVNTQKKTRHFHEGSFHKGELEQKLQEIGL